MALEIGAGSGFVYEAIVSGWEEDLSLELEDEGQDDVMHAGGRGGVRKLVRMDSCSAMLHRDDIFEESMGGNADGSSPTNVICETYKLVAEEEDPFPFPDGTFDLVISSMAFHWVNDLPKLLSEIKVKYNNFYSCV